MSRSVAFKQAHILTRAHKTRYPSDDYRTMFGYYLSELTRPLHTTARVQL